MCIDGRLVKVHEIKDRAKGILADREWREVQGFLRPEFAPYWDCWEPDVMKANGGFAKSHRKPAKVKRWDTEDNGIHAVLEGIYVSLDSLVLCWGYLYGVVRLFGRVVEYQGGYLAEKAEIVEVVATDAIQARRIRRRYQGMFKVSTASTVSQARELLNRSLARAKGANRYEPTS